MKVAKCLRKSREERTGDTLSNYQHGSMTSSPSPYRLGLRAFPGLTTVHRNLFATVDRARKAVPSNAAQRMVIFSLSETHDRGRTGRYSEGTPDHCFSRNCKGTGHAHWPDFGSWIWRLLGRREKRRWQIGGTAKSGAVSTDTCSCLRRATHSTIYSFDRDPIATTHPNCFKYQTIPIRLNVIPPPQSVQPCHPQQQLYQPQFFSLPSTPPPPPPLSTTLPNYIQWMPATAHPTMVTTSTPLSMYPTPIPPLYPIQINHSPSPPLLLPTNPQIFSTLPNPNISTHLMFRVQYLPSSPLNNTPLSSSQINSPHPTHTPTSLITLFSSTSLRVPTNRISVRRVHTSPCLHRPIPHRLPSPITNSLLCPSLPRPARFPLPIQPLTRVSPIHLIQPIA